MRADRILVHDLEFVGRHGVYPEERSEGRRFAVDIEATVALREAGLSDTLGDTVDYRDLANIVLEVAYGPSFHLIEAMAETICARVFSELPAVQGLRLRLRKFATGVPGDPAWVGLEIERSRKTDGSPTD